MKVRPQTLAEVAALAQTGESFDFALRNFLDEFLAKPEGSRLNEEPVRLSGKVVDGERWDAFLAATAETLSAQCGFTAPNWIWDERRILHRPWFAIPWGGLRAVLLLESPAPFRARNLFVSENALARA